MQWCHGAPGITLSRLRAYEILGDESCLAEARIALATTRRNVENDVLDGRANYSLCHGLAGNADVLLLGGQMLGQLRGAEMAAALKVGHVGISRYVGTGVPWPCGGVAETPGLMLGLAGIGHFYLATAFAYSVAPRRESRSLYSEEVRT